MSAEPATICTALRAWRIRSRLRQGAVAQCLGVAQSQISRWESGRDIPRAENLDAIARLICGGDTDPITALRHFVSSSSQHLLLLDDRARILANALPFAQTNSPLHQFGWMLDPVAYPASQPVLSRYTTVMANPVGVVGMTFALPIVQGDVFWTAHLRLTPQFSGAVSVCLAELTVTRSESAADIRMEEIRLGGDGSSRTSLTLWPMRR